MATHSSILAWNILWMEEPGRLQSMGSQRVRHDWATSFFAWNVPWYLEFSWRDLCEAVKLTQSCLTLCDPMDCSPPGSSIHGIFQASILKWVAISSSSRSSWPRDWTWVSHIVGRCFTIWGTRKVLFIRLYLLIYKPHNSLLFYLFKESAIL